ncbi:MAG TPA: CBS domain-containing protein [Marmoricola sp.]
MSTVMSRRVIAIRSDCDLAVAVDTFLASAVRHLVVVEPDRTVRGLLSIEQVLAALGRPGWPGRVSDQVLLEPPRVSPDDDLQRAAEVMLDALVDAVVVADETGRVVGLLTWADLVTHVAGRHLAGEDGQPTVRP